jgi:hypothetical protein
MLLKFKRGNERQQKFYKIQEFKALTCSASPFNIVSDEMLIIIGGSQITVHVLTLRFTDDVLLWEIKERF